MNRSNAEGTFRESRLPERAKPTQEAQEYLLCKKKKKQNKLLNVYLYIYNPDANRNVREHT